MARLNNKVRKEVIRNWTKKKWQRKFDTAIKKLTTEVGKGVECVFGELEVSEDIKKLLIDKRLVVCYSDIAVSHYFRDFTFDGETEPFNYGLKVNSYYRRYNTGRAIAQITDEQLTKLNKVKKQYQKERSDIESILHSVTTDTKLFELLPEFKKYYPKPTKIATTAIIAVDQINQVKELL